MTGRAPGASVRLRLTLSYAAFLMVAGFLLVAVVWVFLLRYVPDHAISLPGPDDPDDGSPGLPGVFIPGRSDLWRAFAPKAALALGVLLAFGLVGGWLLAGRMLAPLHRITEATRTVGGGSLSHRIRLAGRSDEFRELADAFDLMLARLEAQMAEQQRFAANASHELRTPLAVTRTLLDVARRDPGHDHAELLDRLLVVSDRAIDLTEALLLLGRADARAFAVEPVDLSLAAEEAVETLLPLAARHAVTLETRAGRVSTRGSSSLLQQMVTNLVHNGIVHNLPRGGTVTVVTGQGPDGVELTVDSTGPPLTPALVDLLTEPFQRGSDRVHPGPDGHRGAGLGLAIVRSVVRAHAGTLTLLPRPGGGLGVSVRLPAVPSPTAFPTAPPAAAPDALRGSRSTSPGTARR